MYEIPSARHKKALEYALNIIEKSPISKHISCIWLYGSCARNEQKYNSDVDLFIELDISEEKFQELKNDVIFLKGIVSPPNINAPEVDVKIAKNSEWRNNNSLFFKNVRKDGKIIWRK